MLIHFPNACWAKNPTQVFHISEQGPQFLRPDQLPPRGYQQEVGLEAEVDLDSRRSAAGCGQDVGISSPLL